MSNSSWLKKLLSIALVLTIFFILARSLYLNLGTLSLFEWHFRYLMLLVSFLFLSSNFLIAPLSWVCILRMLGRKLSFKQSFRITYLSSVGKYIPGKIWPYVGQVYLAERIGLPKSLTLISMILMFVAYNGLALLFFVATLLLWQGVNRSIVALVWLLVAAFLLVILRKRTLNKAVNFVLGLLGREKTNMTFEYGKMFSLLSLLVVDRLTFSVFAYLFINSFVSLGIMEVVKFSGIFSVSIFLGMVAFVTPAGLGVREGIQTFFLRYFLVGGMAVLIPLLFRCATTLGELVCFSIALKLKSELNPQAEGLNVKPETK